MSFLVLSRTDWGGFETGLFVLSADEDFRSKFKHEGNCHQGIPTKSSGHGIAILGFKVGQTAFSKAGQSWIDARRAPPAEATADFEEIDLQLATVFGGSVIGVVAHWL
jgi:hypothetical protein